MEKNLNYYPLKWVYDVIGKANPLSVQQTEKKGWLYTIGGLTITTNYSHNITSITYPKELKGLGISLMRARHKGYRIDWHNSL